MSNKSMDSEPETPTPSPAEVLAATVAAVREEIAPALALLEHAQGLDAEAAKLRAEADELRRQVVDAEVNRRTGRTNAPPVDVERLSRRITELEARADIVKRSRGPLEDKLCAAHEAAYFAAAPLDRAIQAYAEAIVGEHVRRIQETIHVLHPNVAALLALGQVPGFSRYAIEPLADRALPYLELFEDVAPDPNYLAELREIVDPAVELQAEHAKVLQALYPAVARRNARLSAEKARKTGRPPLAYSRPMRPTD